MYDMRVLKEKAKRTLKATGRWDAMEFAWQSNLSYRTIAMAESTFAGTLVEETAPLTSEVGNVSIGA